MGWMFDCFCFCFWVRYDKLKKREKIEIERAEIPKKGVNKKKAARSDDVFEANFLKKKMRKGERVRGCRRESALSWCMIDIMLGTTCAPR